MKLATLKEGGRDGTLIVVSRDLSKAVRVPGVARTLQAALDEWSVKSPILQRIYEQLNDGGGEAVFDLDTKQLAAPLPRAYQWADASAYVNHVELVRKSRGAEMPESFWTDPLMYQGGSDALLGCNDPIPVQDENWGIDFEAEVAVITDDVPMGISPEAALRHIKLIVLVNDVSLRHLVPAELAKGFGFFQSKPASAFSPVAITPDELGEAWKDGKVHLPLVSYLNHQTFGYPNAGVDMTFHFGQLVAHAARTRFLQAGTIIGSGTVSNKDSQVGSSCLAEKRMLEKLETGESQTPFMKFGDHIRIEMFDAAQKTIFGAIDQTIVPYHPPVAAGKHVA